MMGLLQREETDLGIPFGLQPGQNEVAQYSRYNPANGLGFVTLQPDFFPKHLVILRPFQGKFHIPSSSIISANSYFLVFTEN